MSNSGIPVGSLPQGMHTRVAGTEGVHEVGATHAAAQGKGLLEPQGIPWPLADGRLVDCPEEGDILPGQGTAARFCVVMDCQADMCRATCTMLHMFIVAKKDMNKKPRRFLAPQHTRSHPTQ